MNAYEIQMWWLLMELKGSFLSTPTRKESGLILEEGVILTDCFPGTPSPSAAMGAQPQQHSWDAASCDYFWFDLVCTLVCNLGWGDVTSWTLFSLFLDCFSQSDLGCTLADKKNKNKQKNVFINAAIPRAFCYTVGQNWSSLASSTLLTPPPPWACL